jgi:hypothetical protein
MPSVFQDPRKSPTRRWPVTPARRLPQILVMDGTLGTTNVLIGVLAAVAVLELAALAVVTVVVVRLYRRTSLLLDEVGGQLPGVLRRVGDTATALESAAADVKVVTARAAVAAERAQKALDAVAGLAALTTAARSSLAPPMLRVVSVARGLEAAYRVFRGRAPDRRRDRGGDGRSETSHTEVVHGA